ncbi:unnamed protein product (macronuclear) [Paramecium tetraurelia]|uniref:Uncharacterized protein n=1 Tax=Paramecium tetraurelia TaxID=5888 RepID=A0DCY7_PARTE|nr:uncharacterized protein GSPATT00015763001 [Paramecium tetraurelia]CAK80904.1 unnamed protein product [Paramecium tetraurelia]|eukprot:XP_001448301.1 hypothetical protein (macronuclear) [Paramecium tetraurelia strain d4-2]
MNNYQSFSNPVYEPIPTPLTPKYEALFSSQIQNTSNSNENIDQLKQESHQINSVRKSAQFANEIRHSARSTLSEVELRDIVKHKNYVACQIF